MEMLIIVVVIAVLSFFVSYRFRKKMYEYSLVPMELPGVEVAERMLAAHGIHDVKIEVGEGVLTNHYVPSEKIIRLSSAVYYGCSVFSTSTAAHEVGHAVQDATKMKSMTLRSVLVPIQNLSVILINVLFIAIGVVTFLFPSALPICFKAMLVGYGIFILLSLVTLYVEIDASKRAIDWITESGIVDKDTRSKSIDALRSAAYTYLITAITSITWFCYYWIKLRRFRR